MSTAKKQKLEDRVTLTLSSKFSMSVTAEFRRKDAKMIVNLFLTQAMRTPKP